MIKCKHKDKYDNYGVKGITLNSETLLQLSIQSIRHFPQDIHKIVSSPNSTHNTSCDEQHKQACIDEEKFFQLSKKACYRRTTATNLTHFRFT